MLVTLLAAALAAASAGAPLPPGAAARLGTPTHRPEQALYFADLSPDGKTVAWLDRNDFLTLTDVRTGEATRTTHRPLVGPQARLSYTPDGAGLVVVGQNDFAVWGLAPGKWEAYIPANRTPSAQGRAAVAASGGGKRVAACRGPKDGQLVYAVWDVAANRAVSEVTTPPMEWAAVALSPDGTRFATWGRPEKPKGAAPDPPADPDPARTITFWDADTGTVVRRLTFPDRVAGRQVCFAPDGNSVLVVGLDVELWDTATWKRRWAVRGRPGEWPAGTAVAFAPGGKRFAVLDADGTTVLRDAADGGNATTVPGHGPGHTIRFVADDRAVVLGGHKSAFVAWEVPSGKPLTPVGHHLDAVRLVRFTPDGKQLLSVSDDGELIRWDVATGRPVPKGGLRRPDYAAWVGPHDLLEWVSADGTRGVFGRDHNAVKDGRRPARVFDLAARKEVFATARKADMLWSSNVTVSDGGTRLLLNPGCRAGYPTDAQKTAVWDVATGKAVFEFPQHDAKDNPTWFSPDGRLLVLLEGGTARVWDVSSGKEVCAAKLDGEVFEPAVGVSADGGALAVARRVRPGAVFDLPTGRPRADVVPAWGWPCSPLVFSPDGRLFAVGQGRDAEPGLVQVWEVASGTIRHTFAGHALAAPTVAFRPDGRVLASGSRDGTVLLWDLDHVGDAKGVRGAPAEKLWEALADPDAAKAYPALVELAARPAGAVPLLAKALDPSALGLPTADAVGRLIARLGADEFRDREAAQRDLVRLGRDVLPAAEDALRTDPSEEARRRLAEVVKQVRADRGNGPWARPARAVEVLERAGTPAATEVLRRVAADPKHPLSAAAAAAVRRLGP